MRWPGPLHLLDPVFRHRTGCYFTVLSEGSCIKRAMWLQPAVYSAHTAFGVIPSFCTFGGEFQSGLSDGDFILANAKKNFESKVYLTAVHVSDSLQRPNLTQPRHNLDRNSNNASSCFYHSQRDA